MNFFWKRSRFLPELRDFLSVPKAYTLFQRLVRGKGELVYITTHVRPIPGQRVLDVGCGTGDILRLMPPVDYLGIDSNASYIEAARKRYGAIGTFACTDLTDQNIEQFGKFDIVLATGILHHLDDDDALRLFQLANKTLKAEKRLVSFDGCYVENQSFLARKVLSRDRGKFVRTGKEYVNLASQVFANVESFVYDHILRIPSSVIVMECWNE